MGIAPEGDRRIGVPEDLGYHMKLLAVREKEGSGGGPEIVKAYPGDPRPLKILTKPVEHVVRALYAS